MRERTTTASLDARDIGKPYLPTDGSLTIALHTRYQLAHETPPNLKRARYSKPQPKCAIPG